jgi:hypothetical protein
MGGRGNCLFHNQIRAFNGHPIGIGGGGGAVVFLPKRGRIKEEYGDWRDMGG